MSSAIERVERALKELQQGKLIILSDDAKRENEADMIIAAEKMTPLLMNFMIQQGSGIICITTTAEKLKQLSLPLMVADADNNSNYTTPFTIPIDARENITTGVSAADRTQTILAFVNDAAVPADFVRPGHVFPLQARPGGVLERQGHTEASLDLAHLAGFKAAVLCEVMNIDGSMMRDKELSAFIQQHNFATLSIEDIITYRLSHENHIASESTASLPLDKYGAFKATVVKEKITQQEHLVLVKEKKEPHLPLLVRIHSSCVTGDLFSSLRCDCHKQLHYSLERISQEGGMLIYLNQEGRGIGLFNKIKAYGLQEEGYDTVSANQKLGFPADMRKYHIAANILRNAGITQVRLLTNNPHKIEDLKKYGLQHVEQLSMPTFCSEHNLFYLQTKNEKLRHTMHKE